MGSALAAELKEKKSRLSQRDLEGSQTYFST